MEKYFLLIIIGILSGSVGQLLMKLGVNQSLSLLPEMDSFKNVLLSTIVFLKNYKILLALILYGLGVFLWFLILTKFELSYAFPIMSGTYIVVLVLSWFFLKEDITTLRVVGTLLITLGIILVAKSA